MDATFKPVLKARMHYFNTGSPPYMLLLSCEMAEPLDPTLQVACGVVGVFFYVSLLTSCPSQPLFS